MYNITCKICGIRKQLNEFPPQERIEDNKPHKCFLCIKTGNTINLKKKMNDDLRRLGKYLIRYTNS
jgi:hypothetical protein